MLASLPRETTHFIGRPWSEIEPHYQELRAHTLTAATVDSWLAGWTFLTDRVDETYRRLEVASTRNTADNVIADQFHFFLDNVYEPASTQEQLLKEKLLASGLQPAGFEIPLKKMRVEATLFRTENLPLLSQEKKLAEQYFSIMGAQTVEWEGEEVPLLVLQPLLQETDRSLRERVWRLIHGRMLQDRDAVDDVWRQLLEVRRQLPANAGYPDYRAYRWDQLRRFDYGPDDCRRFHQAVEELVVPVVARLAEGRRLQLGVDRLRPWDMEVDPAGRPPLRPFSSIPELLQGAARILHRVDPELGAYFDTMVSEDLLDLETRKNKANIGYCLPYNASRRLFIFLNTVGLHGDLVGLLHEAGHAFHVFEMAHLSYFQQRDIESLCIEFGEVGSTAMELLALPYLARDQGGFYTREEADRVQLEYLEDSLRNWCWISMVDAFQHWVYENPATAAQPDACDEQYGVLAERFLPGCDWTDLEPEIRNGWRTIPHIHEIPFYFLEYGLAQLGAFQIWARALHDQAGAVARYRAALQLGETRPMPELFEAAGARLGFDAATLRPSVELIERTIESLQASLFT